jgi:hypothetical protein
MSPPLEVAAVEDTSERLAVVFTPSSASKSAPPPMRSSSSAASGPPPPPPAPESFSAPFSPGKGGAISPLPASSLMVADKAARERESADVSKQSSRLASTQSGDRDIELGLINQSAPLAPQSISRPSAAASASLSPRGGKQAEAKDKKEESKSRKKAQSSKADAGGSGGSAEVLRRRSPELVQKRIAADMLVAARDDDNEDEEEALERQQSAPSMTGEMAMVGTDMHNVVVVHPGASVPEVWAGFYKVSSMQEGLLLVVPGGCLALCAGTYHDAVTISKPMTLIGAEERKTVMEGSVVIAASHVRVECLDLRAPEVRVHGPVTDVRLRGVHLVSLVGTGDVDVVLEHCVVERASGAAVSVSWRSRLVLEGCTVQFAGSDGVVVGGHAKVHLQSTQVRHCHGHGIVVNDAATLTAAESSATNNGQRGLVSQHAVPAGLLLAQNGTA